LELGLGLDMSSTLVAQSERKRRIMKQIYRFRYYLAEQLAKAERKSFTWRIKLENKNYWNEYHKDY
jgi:hypothetical protein